MRGLNHTQLLDSSRPLCIYAVPVKDQRNNRPTNFNNPILFDPSRHKLQSRVVDTEIIVVRAPHRKEEGNIPDFVMNTVNIIVH
ncbi:Protein of unknown function [Pyronema omphalodes CBS 100304]|uniref:Uncharacterized protein n=1 Tax=Pyronema omphalodes (strain CBS 100304) TaxID=1076935 RepID=U4LR13_PYROM|nr:Protein of unknown function [Pyronema omphalodes CBS 100304]